MAVHYEVSTTLNLLHQGPRVQLIPFLSHTNTESTAQHKLRSFWAITGICSAILKQTLLSSDGKLKTHLASLNCESCMPESIVPLVSPKTWVSSTRIYSKTLELWVFHQQHISNHWIGNLETIVQQSCFDELCALDGWQNSKRFFNTLVLSRGAKGQALVKAAPQIHESVESWGTAMHFWMCKHFQYCSQNHLADSQENCKVHTYV